MTAIAVVSVIGLVWLGCALLVGLALGAAIARGRTPVRRPSRDTPRRSSYGSRRVPASGRGPVRTPSCRRAGTAAGHERA